MSKINNQNSFNDEINQHLESSKLAVEERKLEIEEKKLALEKDRNEQDLLVEKEKIKVERLKIWLSPIFAIALSVISLSATAYVAYWSRKEVEASRIEVYTHTRFSYKK